MGRKLRGFSTARLLLQADEEVEVGVSVALCFPTVETDELIALPDGVAAGSSNPAFCVEPPCGHGVDIPARAMHLDVPIIILTCMAKLVRPRDEFSRDRGGGKTPWSHFCRQRP